MARNFVNRALKVCWIESINISFEDTEMNVQKISYSDYVTIKQNEKTLDIEDYSFKISGNFAKYCCLPVVFSKVLAARKTILITARARKIKRSTRMLANALKDHSIPLLFPAPATHEDKMFPKSLKLLLKANKQKYGLRYPLKSSTENQCRTEEVQACRQNDIEM